MQTPGFADVTSVRPDSDSTFRADVSPEWMIGGKPNGGYLLAILGRAATGVVAHDHVVAASAHFLQSPESGPVEIDTEVLRSGRSASQVRARLRQGGRPCVEAVMTVGRLEAGTTPHWQGAAPAGPIAARTDCVRVPVHTPSGLVATIMGQVDIRLDPRTLGFAGGHPSGRGELDGWLELPHAADFDPVSLLYAVDALPPATFEIELTGWVPTLELTVYVRALPAPGPVRVLHRAHLVEAQRVDETCWVWDSTGRLVAQGTQLAGIRLG